MLDSLNYVGYVVTHVEPVVEGYLVNETLTRKLSEYLENEKFDLIITLDYFPFISNLARDHKVKYASWIYDCPHYKLNSIALINEYNYIFVFDQLQLVELQKRGARNVFYMPLPVNTRRLERQLGNVEGYKDEVSFVGSLYEKNNFSKITGFSDYAKGFLEALINTQRLVYGCNVISGTLSSIQDEINQLIDISNEPTCQLDKMKVFEDMILERVTSDDRVILLNMLSSICDVSLYSNSSHEYCPKAINRGTVDYITEMPLVFRESKINLNISLRSIQSGIPLRCMDVMGAGGFLISNYQPELAELFIPNEEFVYYEDDIQAINPVHLADQDRVIAETIRVVNEI